MRRFPIYSLNPRHLISIYERLKRPFSPIRIHMIAPTGKCGIAEYTKSLIEQMPQWVQFVDSEICDIIHLQYEPGLFPDREIILKWAKQPNPIKVITAHYYDDWLKAHANLFDWIIVHARRFAGKKKHQFLTQGCPVFPKKDKLELRQKLHLQLEDNSRILASFGFYMDWKRLDYVFENLAPYLALNPKIHLLWLHSIHPKAEILGKNIHSHINHLIAIHRIENQITYPAEYLSKAAINDYLQAADIGFLWSESVDSAGSSASSKEFVSGRCPLVVSDISHYQDLERGIVRVSIDRSIHEFFYQVLNLAFSKQLKRLRHEQEENYKLLNYKHIADIHAGWYWELIYGK